MVARLQQATTLGLLAAVAFWVLGFLRAGHTLWAASGAAAILFGYALFLGLEFALLSVVNRADTAPPATVRQRLLAWCGEALSTPQVFCWRQPFRSRSRRDWLPAAEPGRSSRRGVLLVHGFACNRGFWNPWMLRLRRTGVPHVAIDLEPPFDSIDGYAPAIEEAVRRLEVSTGCSPVVVAHSMGGLAVRAWLVRFMAAERVHRLVTIGTPHHGAWLARFACSRNTAEMRLGSPWLEALERAESRPGAKLDPRRCTCFFSHCDNVVFPASTATLPGADNRHVAGSAHVHLAFVPEVLQAVFSLVGEADAR